MESLPSNILWTEGTLNFSKYTTITISPGWDHYESIQNGIPASVIHHLPCHD